VKVLDFRKKMAELETDPNPFALVVMAHLEAQAASTDAERLRVKLSLIRRLYGRGHGRKDIIHLFRFIDWLLVLSPELEFETRRQVAELEGATPMPYVTSIERLAKEEGLREGLLEAIELGLELRFGREALQALPRIREVLDVDRLRALKAALTRVATPAEFESLLGRS